MVDDNDAVRKLIELLLTSAGHRTVRASTVAEAGSLPDLGAIDVALVDLDLGGESGLELLAALQARHPALRGILISGSCEELDVAGVPCLQKPFSRAQLLDAVAAARRRGT